MSDLAEQRKMYQEVIDKLEEENNNLKNELMEDMKTESKLNEEIKKLKSEIENMKEVGRENIETLDRMSIELENYNKSFKRYWNFSKQELADSLYDMEEQNKKLKEERDFFKEQAILWRKDYKNEYEKNRKLEERIKELETDYDRLKVAFEDVVSGK